MRAVIAGSDSEKEKAEHIMHLAKHTLHAAVEAYTEHRVTLAKSATAGSARCSLARSLACSLAGSPSCSLPCVCLVCETVFWWW